MLKRILFYVLLCATVVTGGCSTSIANSNIASNTFRDSNLDKAAKIEKIIQQQLSRMNNPNSYEKPVLLKDYGVPIRNPFRQLPTTAEQIIIKAGIDIKTMSSYKARYVSGHLTGARSLNIINTDPTTILVIGTGTVTHGGVYSRGPVVVVGDVNLMGALYSKDLVWGGDAAGRGTPSIGLPIVRQTGNDSSVSFGISPYSAKEEVAAHIQLGAKKAGKERLNANYQEVQNPLNTITASQVQLLQKHGINVEQLASLRAVVYTGSSHESILNDDPQTLLVIKEGWGSGDVVSAGPVISYKEHITNTQLSANLLWFASANVNKDSISPGDDIRGMPLIVGKE